MPPSVSPNVAGLRQKPRSPSRRHPPPRPPSKGGPRDVPAIRRQQAARPARLVDHASDPRCCSRNPLVVGARYPPEHRGLHRRPAWIGDFIGRMLPPNFAFMAEAGAARDRDGADRALGHLARDRPGASGLLLRGAKSLALRLGIPWSASGAERDARHQRDHSGADLRGGRRPRPIRRRPCDRAARCRYAGQVLRRSDREIDEGPLDALRAAGAGTLQRIVFGVFAAVLPAWIGVVLYRFETNIRVSTVLAWSARAASASNSSAR